MFQFFKDYQGLPKEFYVLFLANVINRFGDFVSPLLALYLTQKLDMSTSASSVIVTIALLSRMPGSFLGGKLADHFGRRKIYLSTQTLAAFLLLPCAFTSNPHLIIILLVTSTFFNGAVRPALDALAIDLMPIEKRKLGLSLMYLGINIGVSVGPALAGLLFKVNLPLFFMIDVLTSLIAVGLVSTLISETYIEKMAVTHMSSEAIQVKNNATTASILSSNRKLASFIFITSGFSMIYVQVKFALPLLFAHVFAENGSALLGTIFSINAITVVLSTSVITLKTKNNPTFLNIILGGLFYTTGFGLYAFVSGYPLYVIATVVWTFGEILMATNVKAYIADHTPIDFRGRINAFYLVLKAGMSGLGVLLSGWLIPIVGPVHIWLFVLTASIFLCVLLYFVNKKNSLF